MWFAQNKNNNNNKLLENEHTPSYLVTHGFSESIFSESIFKYIIQNNFFCDGQTDYVDGTYETHILISKQFEALWFHYTSAGEYRLYMSMFVWVINLLAWVGICPYCFASVIQTSIRRINGKHETYPENKIL